MTPTRVVWRLKTNFLTTRVFPTSAAAWAFAATLPNLVLVQDAKEAPPKQSPSVNKAFATPGSGYATVLR